MLGISLASSFLLAAHAGLMHEGGWESMKITKVAPIQVMHMVYKAA